MSYKARFSYSRSLIVLMIACFTIFQSSCRSRKNFAYFQGDAQTIDIKPHQALIMSSDLLSIQVSSSNPELAIPFNPYSTLSASQPSGYINGIASASGYLVDENGDIIFPYIGKIHVAGKSREELTKYLQDELAKYLSEPLVYIRILNFKVTVLGDVKNPGTFNIPNEKINMIEALGLAGDLNNSALRKNVILIRTGENKTKQYTIDLTTQDIFKSEAFYLQQGDIIYVEANKAQRNAAAINNRIGIVISVATLLLTTLTLLL